MKRTRLRQAAQQGLCQLIRLYQRYISPALGSRKCRFSPTCSSYGIQAIQTHGCIKGLLLTIWRVGRCNPLGRWGYDPVPRLAPGAAGEKPLSVPAVFHKAQGKRWKITPRQAGDQHSLS